jgi:amino acid transporter
LNAIFSLNTGSLITSYMITIGCTILYRLRGHSFPPSRFSLGKWGLPINIAAMCYLVPVFIFSFFPANVIAYTSANETGELSCKEALSFWPLDTMFLEAKTLTVHRIQSITAVVEDTYESRSNDVVEKSGMCIEQRSQHNLS